MDTVPIGRSRSHLSELLRTLASWLKVLLVTRILYSALAVVGLVALVARCTVTPTQSQPLTELALLPLGPLLLVLVAVLFRGAARVPPSQKALPPILRGARYRDRPASYLPPRVLLGLWSCEVFGAVILLWRHSDRLLGATMLVGLGVGAITAAYVWGVRIVEARWR